MPFDFKRRRRGRFERARGGRGFSPGGYCICPNYGLTVAYQPGVPCYQTKCVKCGSPMVHKFTDEI